MTYTSLGSATKPTTSGVDYRLRVRVNGGTVQARAWQDGTTEPTAWDINATTTVTASGYFGFVCGAGVAAASVTCDFDDISIT